MTPSCCRLRVILSVAGPLFTSALMPAHADAISNIQKGAPAALPLINGSPSPNIPSQPNSVAPPRPLVVTVPTPSESSCNPFNGCGAPAPVAQHGAPLVQSSPPATTTSSIYKLTPSTPPKPQPTAARNPPSPSAASVKPAPPTAAVGGYTFQTTQYGTVDVYQNGQHISTSTPQNAATAYGYTPSPTTKGATAPALPQKSVATGTVANSGTAPSPASKSSASPTTNSTSTATMSQQAVSTAIPGQQTAAQRAATFAASGLSPAQQAAVIAGVPYYASSSPAPGAATQFSGTAPANAAAGNAAQKTNLGASSSMVPSYGFLTNGSALSTTIQSSATAKSNLGTSPSTVVPMTSSTPATAGISATPTGTTSNTGTIQSHGNNQGMLLGENQGSLGTVTTQSGVMKSIQAPVMTNVSFQASGQSWVNAPLNQAKGTLSFTDRNGNPQTVVSLSNGPQSQEGKLDNPNQCVDLIVNYAQALGLKDIPSTKVIGDGKDVAKNFAANSQGEFHYEKASVTTVPPAIGGVISVDKFVSAEKPPRSDPAGHVGIAQQVTLLDKKGNAVTDPNQASSAQVKLFDQNLGGGERTVNFNKSTNGSWVGSVTIDNTSVPIVGWANPT